MQTILDRKPLIYLWRPFYLLVFNGILWPVVRKIGTISNTAIVSELGHLRQTNNRLSGIVTALDDRLAVLERHNAQQLAAIEQLLLCAFADNIPPLDRQYADTPDVRRTNV